jgi:hypothetical protein
MLIVLHEIIQTVCAKNTTQYTGHVGFSVTYCIHLRLDILEEFFPFSLLEVSQWTKPFIQGPQVEQTEIV